MTSCHYLLGLVKNGVERLRAIALLGCHLGTCCQTWKAADRFGLSRLVLQNIPMLSKNAVFEPDNVGGDPGGGPSHPCEAAMRYGIIAFGDDELILIVQRLRQ